MYYNYIIILFLIASFQFREVNVLWLINYFLNISLSYFLFFFQPVHKHLKKSKEKEYLDELVSSKLEKIDLSQINSGVEIKAEEVKINLNEEKLPEKKQTNGKC